MSLNQVVQMILTLLVVGVAFWVTYEQVRQTMKAADAWAQSVPAMDRRAVGHLLLLLMACQILVALAGGVALILLVIWR